MTTAIIIVLIIGICVIGVRSYAKKLSHGCCGAGGDEVKKISKHADLSEYKYRYSVKTGGMTCKNCALRIENAFNRQGDIYAKVDYKTGLSEVLSKAPLSDFVLRNTIIGLGYTVDEINIIEL